MRDPDERINELRALGARIGRDVFLGPDVYIERDFAPLLTIEDGVVLARGVAVLLHDSALNNVTGAPLKFGRVTLRQQCYVGANTTILCGTTIGAGAIIGAGSLVTGDVPAGMVAYGSPARLHGTVKDLDSRYRERASDDRYVFLALPPWRERQSGPAAAEAGAAISALLEAIARRSAAERSGPD